MKRRRRRRGGLHAARSSRSRGSRRSIRPRSKVAAARLGVPVHQPAKVSRTDETRRPTSASLRRCRRRLPPTGASCRRPLLDIPDRLHQRPHVAAAEVPRRRPDPVGHSRRRVPRRASLRIRMDDPLDPGPMLLRRATPIGPDETRPSTAVAARPHQHDLVVRRSAVLDEIVPNRKTTRSPRTRRSSRESAGWARLEHDARSIADRCRGFQRCALAPAGRCSTEPGCRRLWVVEALPVRRGLHHRPDRNSHRSAPQTGSSSRAVTARAPGLRAAAQGQAPDAVRDFQNGIRLELGHRVGTPVQR